MPNNEKRVHINGFVIGATNRISHRLMELVKARTPKTNSMALVVAKQALIKTKMDEIQLMLRQPRQRGSSINIDSHKAGQSAGDRAQFGRPVSGQHATLRVEMQISNGKIFINNLIANDGTDSNWEIRIEPGRHIDKLIVGLFWGDKEHSTHQTVISKSELLELLGHI